jgi:hypothetical protein
MSCHIVEAVDDEGLLFYMVMDGMTLVACTEDEHEALEMCRQHDQDSDPSDGQHGRSGGRNGAGNVHG